MFDQLEPFIIDNGSGTIKVRKKHFFFINLGLSRLDTRTQKISQDLPSNSPQLSPVQGIRALVKSEPSKLLFSLVMKLIRSEVFAKCPIQLNKGKESVLETA